MFIKNDILASTIRDILSSEGIPNPDALTQKIMDPLTTYQRSIAKEGSVKGGRPQKDKT